jgi:hypothetical protein
LTTQLCTLRLALLEPSSMNYLTTATRALSPIGQPIELPLQLTILYLCEPNSQVAVIRMEHQHRAHSNTASNIFYMCRWVLVDRNRISLRVGIVR